jgi:hypothetical protein
LSLPVTHTGGVKDRDIAHASRVNERPRATGATYFIWKWADNNLPGRPADVVADLCAGKCPPTIQAFDRRLACRRLAAVAGERRSAMTDLFISDPPVSDNHTSYIHVCDASPNFRGLANKLLWAVWPMNLTLYDETHNRLLGLPKRNVVESPADGRQFVDIQPGEVPTLLRALDQRWHLAAMTCYDRQGNMFQVWAHRHRFAVEWQVLPDRDFSRHRIWIAGRTGAARRRARLGPPRRFLDLDSAEVLTMADAHRLWVRFLAGDQRPPQYEWREITDELSKPGSAPRCRHLQTEEGSPP